MPHVDDPIIKPKQREHLIECQDLAQLSHTLGTIRTDAPVDTDEGAYRIGEGDKPAAVRLLRELEIHSLIPRFGLEDIDPSADPEAAPLPEAVCAPLPAQPAGRYLLAPRPAVMGKSGSRNVVLQPEAWYAVQGQTVALPWKMQTCCACWTTTRCSWTYSTRLRCMPKQWPQADGAAASSGMASWLPTCWMPLPPSTMWANWPGATRPRPPLSVRIGRMPAAWRICSAR